MLRPSHASLFAALAFSVAVGGIADAQSTERAGPLVLAQAPLTEQEKAKRKEQERQKGPPPGDKGPARTAGRRRHQASPGW